ncbi:hypothetical protein OF897_06980 [Chryseobacterium formosus]|uniref:Uncharacterized protein n=1 Tax=Chryseobacterium formosus TaxID=1537363 RepID=A0ABT3XNF3_9FLAO|nr:hypothetical protein [Chryseobacterium formosus]MCX8523664.1 hypothetical protein [Chryseobacterium formosus]
MAIIKNAKNINIQVKNEYKSISKVSYEESEEVIIDALNENLELSSQKRVVKQGFGKESKDDDNKYEYEYEYEEKDIKILVDEGVVKKGYWINEHGKTVIVNNKGHRGYDWEFGDNPNKEMMKANGMSDYDIFNVDLTKSYTETYLKTEFKGTLVGFSDVEDGFGQNGRDLANHFFSKQGIPFVFGVGSNPSNEVKDSGRFKKDFLNNLKEELKKRYKEKKYINQSLTNIYQFSTKLPYYGPAEAIYNPFVNEAAAFIGGIQGCIASYKIYQFQKSKEIDVEISKVSFLDTFGAGWEDGGASGMVKQWIPGLVAMFCLQHFKNVKDKTKYQPFAVIIDIDL